MFNVRADRNAVFRRILADVRAGNPQVMWVEGPAGVGKSSHLDALQDAADGFATLRAAGEPGPFRPALGVLSRLGVDRVVTDAGTPLSVASAAQALRRVVDEHARDTPVLILIDDAQWVDDETAEAVKFVVERADGDRLLVAIASRPDSRNDATWRHLRLESRRTTHVMLDGLDLAEAASLIESVVDTDDVPPAFAERLWRHTGRNPQHLRALMLEYSLDELEQMEQLPAPLDVAQELTARLAALEPDAVTLLRAIAVIGDTWVDRMEAAAVAGLEVASDALDVLLTSRLLITRAGGPLADVRIEHALTRAGIYQSTPSSERRLRHRLAATSLSSPMRRLEHEVAAATTRDAHLAERLEVAAEAAQRESDHRREAQLLNWSSQLSPIETDRERRWLDAQIATILARDTRAVRSRVSEIAWSADVLKRSVVLAWLLIAENRLADARRLLEEVPAETLEAGDLRTRSRLLVLTAWTMLVSDYGSERIREVLARVPSPDDLDPAVRGFYLRTTGQLAGREMNVEEMQHSFDAIPAEARETPIALTDMLSWRGAVYSICGFSSEARKDLAEVIARMRSGRIDDSSVDHALYAMALWQDGELDRAAGEFTAAMDLTTDQPHPLVQAALPLVPAIRGDFQQADALLQASESALRDLPWREAIIILMQAQVARLHAGGDVASQHTYLRGLRRSLGGDPAQTIGGVEGAIWQLHVAIAKLWADELSDLDEHLDAIEADMIVPDWARWCRPWITGLRAERSGEPREALRLLLDAQSKLNLDLPLYRAHVHADLARVASANGESSIESTAREQARLLYAKLGAHPYLERVGSEDDRAPDAFSSLSEREREVVSLAVSGFSYAQIGEELYVTRSTVAYHLGNIYAKVGVSTRHELTQLARGHARV